MRILDALDRYLLHLRSCGRSHHTIQQASRHISVLERWLASEGRNHDVDFIDHEVLAFFFVSDLARLKPDGRPKLATSLNALRGSVRAFFGFVAAAGLAARDPSRLVRRARCAPPPPRSLSDEERRRLLDVLDHAETDGEQRDRVLFRLLLATGIRIGSAVALDVEDVDLEAGHLHLRTTKAGGAARVIIPDAIVSALREFVGLRSSGPLFPGRRGRVTTRHIQRRFATWLERAGITRAASPHSLRHSFATRLLARTGDLRLVQTALTHRSIASTTIYATVDECRLRAAVNA